MESWRERCFYHMEQATKREKELQKELDAQTANAEHYRQQAQNLQNKLEALEARYDDKSADYIECNAERIERGAKLQEAEQTITELKAKLYDLMTA